MFHFTRGVDRIETKHLNRTFYLLRMFKDCCTISLYIIFQNQIKHNQNLYTSKYINQTSKEGWMPVLTTRLNALYRYKDTRVYRFHTVTKCEPPFFFFGKGQCLRTDLLPEITKLGQQKAINKKLLFILCGKKVPKFPVAFPQMFLEIISAREFLGTMRAREGDACVLVDVILQLLMKKYDLIYETSDHWFLTGAFRAILTYGLTGLKSGALSKSGSKGASNYIYVDPIQSNCYLKNYTYMKIILQLYRIKNAQKLLNGSPFQPGPQNCFRRFWGLSLP